MSSSPQSWLPELDALVAAPRHHRLVLENDRVRVLETRIDAGDQTAVHTHRWPTAMYVLAWSDFVRRDGEGRVMLDTRVAGVRANPGDGGWMDAMGPHSVENVGTGPLHVISVELKDA